jgi:hypothetical protein
MILYTYSLLAVKLLFLQCPEEIFHSSKERYLFRRVKYISSR